MEQFSRMDDVEVRTVDGFELMGRKGVKFARMYGVFTRHAPAAFNMSWKITMKHPPRPGLEVRLSKRRFADQIRRFQPDLILTVHSLFNSALTRMLETLGMDIPVVVLQADLINIHSTWCNPQALMTICPTMEAYEASLGQGMPLEKLKIIGFPVRSRFCETARTTEKPAYDPSRPLRCLLMSGGEGSGRLKACAENILEHTDAELTIICGRNSKMQHVLQKNLGARYGERVKVLGFVSAVEQEMLRNDLLITRGSPNTMVEAAVMALPFVMTGPMLEQEKDNPRLMEKYNLGIKSESPEDIPQIIQSLLDNGAARLLEIQASQRSWRSFDSAREIAGFVAELTKPEA